MQTTSAPRIYIREWEALVNVLQRMRQLLQRTQGGGQQVCGCLRARTRTIGRGPSAVCRTTETRVMESR